MVLDSVDMRRNVQILSKFFVKQGEFLK